MATRRGLRSPRLARKERHRQSRRMLLYSFLALGVAGVIIYLVSLPSFRIAQIEVQGAESGTMEKIKTIAEENLTGISRGFIPKTHPFFYPRATITREVLTNFPELADASVSLDGFSTLSISVTPRAPVALWCDNNNACLFIDATGLAFARAPREANASYYRLSSQNAGTTTIPAQILAPERLISLLSFLAEVKNLGLSPASVVFDHAEGVEIKLRNGSRLKLLPTEGYPLALRRLSLLLGESGLVPRQKESREIVVDYIDLRYGNKVYLKAR